MLSTVLGVILGGLITIGVALGIEFLRLPRLSLELDSPRRAKYAESAPAKSGRFLRINLLNERLPSVFGWMLRSAALQCAGTISFYQLDGRRVFREDMSIRFARTPEPVPVHGFVGNWPLVLFDARREALNARVDVYPGESTPLDVAARFDTDGDAYAWSNQNYFSDPLWRDPNWKLPRGLYLVLLTVSSSGRKCQGLFRLHNDANVDDFRLDLANHEDYKSIRRYEAGVPLEF